MSITTEIICSFPQFLLPNSVTKSGLFPQFLQSNFVTKSGPFLSFFSQIPWQSLVFFLSFFCQIPWQSLVLSSVSSAKFRDKIWSFPNLLLFSNQPTILRCYVYILKKIWIPLSSNFILVLWGDVSVTLRRSNERVCIKTGMCKLPKI
jgi:hypothetical protein